MIKLNKTFYSIGQGGFYSEKIFFGHSVLTIVYDCGSLNQDRLKKEIEQSGLGIIDYLVISHFHKDHINGIWELKNKYKIKNVIIPKLNPLDIAFYLGTRNTVENLLLNPVDFFSQSDESENPNIISISPENEVINFEPNDILPNNIPHSNNVPVYWHENEPVWVLRFYVDEMIFDHTKLTKNQEKLLNNISKIKDYEDNKEELIKAYRSLAKRNINFTSMSMVSAPIPSKSGILYWDEGNISILNGDTLLNSENRIEKFVNHFMEFSNFKFDIQIPHHGSHHNLLRPLNEFRINQGVIHSGYDNNYGHPSGTILRKLKDHRIHTKILTEFDRNLKHTNHFFS